MSADETGRVGRADWRLHRAFERLLKQCERLTRSVDRDAEDRRSKQAPGCLSSVSPSAAVIRDIIDAAKAGRAALAASTTDRRGEG